MYVLCYLFETNCFVHSFRAKDYLILKRYSKEALSVTILTQKLHKTLRASLLLKVLGTVGKPFRVVVGIFG